MSSEDDQLGNVFRYKRKTFKKRRTSQDNDEPRNDETTNLVEILNPINLANLDVKSLPPECSCDMEHDEEIAHILHKKCPVITLAHHQMQRLLNETDKFIFTNNRCCRSINDCLYICKDVFCNHRNCGLVLLAFSVMSFFIGLIMGAASCGSYLGRFNSPILTCIDNFFIPDTYPTVHQTYRSIV